jgi:hypothetical protein
MSSQQQSHLTPPSPLSHGYYLTPTTGNEMQTLVVDATANDWHQESAFGDLSSTSYQQEKLVVDPMLSQWNAADPTPRGVDESANMFHQSLGSFVSLSDIERSQPSLIGDSVHQDDLDDIWCTEHGAQDFDRA